MRRAHTKMAVNKGPLAAGSALAVIVLVILIPVQAKRKAPEKELSKDAAAEFPAVVWHDPGDISKLNLVYGAGGRDHAPDPRATYRFIREVTTGASPKFDVEDAQGIRWKVKVGSEAQTETVATRFLWAMGYFVDEDYYLPEIRVRGLKIDRGREYASGETVHGARLERHLDSVKEIGGWFWAGNPLSDTREMNGLRIMMALINNWDLKYQNNAIYAVAGERRYLVSDVGSSFGKTGPANVRTENNLAQYAESPFIRKVAADHVDFVMNTRPFPLFIALYPLYLEGIQRQNVATGIPRADARWLATRLNRLSESQIRECFESVGYPRATAEGFSQVVRKRIVQLNKL